MRVHITLDEDVVEQLDARVGSRRRSRFIEEAVKSALADQQRWDALEAAIGSVSDSGHAWDADPAAWVRSQRTTDERRLG